MKIDELTLMAGVDIPVPKLRVNIHQPTIREIAVIGEEKFYDCLGILNINQDSVINAMIKSIPEIEGVSIEDIRALVKNDLGNLSNFEILMQRLNNDKDEDRKSETKEDIANMLKLIMPSYNFSIETDCILGLNMGDLSFILSIREKEFDILKEVINVIFCLTMTNIDNKEFNPANDRAKAIADKILKGRERVKRLKGNAAEKPVSILSNYLSCLGIGSNALNLINAIDLTIYQLFNQMKRFGLKSQYDNGLSAMMQGAKDIELVDWLQGL